MRAHWRNGLQIALILAGAILVAPSQPARASIDPVELSDKAAVAVVVAAQQARPVMTRFMLQVGSAEALSAPWAGPAPMPSAGTKDSSTLSFSWASYRPFLPSLDSAPYIGERSLPRSDGIPRQVFGSVAISVSGPVHMAQWKRILAEQADLMLTGACNPHNRACSNPLLQRARQVVRDARPLEREAKARLINRFVNETLRYATDIEIYGQADHWATLTESFARGRGDCEDIAIAKMWMLKAAGVDMADLHLTIGRQLRLREDHAILVMKSYGNQNLYLDNLNNSIEGSTSVAAFQPLVSYGARGSWIHGFQRASSETATGIN